jgi:hypothetical protein
VNNYFCVRGEVTVMIITLLNDHEIIKVQRCKFPLSRYLKEKTCKLYILQAFENI